MKIIVIHTIEGAVKTDILTASRITAQRRGDSVDVSFPNGDGVYEVAMSHHTSTGTRGHWFVNYRNCDKFDLMTSGEDAGVVTVRDI